MTRSLGLWWVTGPAMLALLAACNGNGNDTPMADPKAQQVIGAAGGQLVSPDGSLTLQVPAGALAQNSTITVTEVAAANQSDLVRAQGPARVYRLEPDGLTFTKPATVTVDLPPSVDGQLMFALLASASRFEPLQSSALDLGASQRRLTGRLTHFSELLIFDFKDLRVSASVAPRSIKVGETLDATLSVSKIVPTLGSDIGLTVEAASDYIATSHPADLVFVTENLTDFFNASPPVTLPEGLTSSAASLQTWRCVREHVGTMRFEFTLTGRLPVGDGFGGVAYYLPFALSPLKPAAIDYVCDAAVPPPSGLRTGLFTLPFGMTAPDGVHLIDGAFANLGGSGPFLSLAGSNGAVIIDLKSGLSALNMTPSGPDGRLGNGALLGALPVSLPNPGPTTVAGLFATSAAGGAVRSYTQRSGSGFIWGGTLLQPVLLDASPAGGGYVSEEVVTTMPGLGLNLWTVPTGAAFWQFASRIDTGWFSGRLVSSVLPVVPGGPVLALTTGTDGGTTSTVWSHDRSLAAATPLFTLPDAGAKRLRCGSDPLPSAGPGPVYVCGVTAGTKAWFFNFGASDPKATVTPVPADAGADALGIDIRVRSNGKTSAVVANFGDTKLNVIDFDGAGAVTANRTVDLPPGCTGVAHAVLASDAGSDYVFGACNGSAAWFGTELRF